MTDVLANLGQQRLAGQKARHRHVWKSEWQTGYWNHCVCSVSLQPDWDGHTHTCAWEECRTCGQRKDPTRSARGRSSRSRGNRRELELARALNGEKVGMYGGPVDVQTSLINAQSKVRRGAAFPGWMVDELAKLPRTGGRIPALIVTDSPGAGIRRRCLVVLDFDDFTELHGRIQREEAP